MAGGIAGAEETDGEFTFLVRGGVTYVHWQKHQPVGDVQVGTGTFDEI